MSETIGQLLEAARKALGLSIEDVAHKTRVHHDVLRRLEADELDKLPNAMFAKSFISIYSEYLGVDASNAIAQLNAADDHHGEQYLLGGINPQIRENFGRLTSRIPVRPILASAAAVASLVIGGSYLVSHLYGSQQGSPQRGTSSIGKGVIESRPVEELPDTATEISAANERPETEPINNWETPLIPKNVPSAPSDTGVDDSAPVDPASIPRAIRKAEPVDSTEIEDGDVEEEEPETASSESSEETYAPFIVTPSVTPDEE